MITFREIKKYKDGSASYQYDYDEEFERFYKEKTGNTKLDNKEVSEFIIKYLTELAGEEPVKEVKKKSVKRTPKKKTK